jgi:ribonuclease-3
MNESGCSSAESSPLWAEFQRLIGYDFKDVSLLRLALTHPSISHETGGTAEDNQRLEFLGDAVLGLVLARELYERFTHLEEGPLTKARARMVNAKTLAETARGIDLGRFLLLSRGEEQNGGRARLSALADAYEAVIGAVYLDGGLPAAAQFVLSSFEGTLAGLGDISPLDNPKGELQEFLQARSNETPQYDLTSVSGPDHDRNFESVVRHAGVELGRGQGKSKKAAESEAALAALSKLRSSGSGDHAVPS